MTVANSDMPSTGEVPGKSKTFKIYMHNIIIRLRLFIVKSINM